MFQRFIRTLALAATAGFAIGALAQGEPIKIGAVLSTTGPVGFIGDPQQKQLELQIKRINERGGLLGRKLQLVVYDDQSDPNNANTFAKRLIDSDKIDLLIGGTVSPSALAMVPHAEKAGVPFISTGGSIALVEPVKKWVFKTPPTDRLVAERILQDMKDRKLTKIAMLSDTGGFGQSGRKEIEGAASKYGVTVVVQDTYGPKDTDVTPQLTKIRNTPGLDALLVFCGAGPSPVVAIKNIAQLGIKLPVFMPHAAVNMEYIKLGGAATEGTRMPTAAFVVVDAMPDNDPAKKVGLDFYAAYKEAYKTDASPFGSNPADALMIAADAIKRAGTTDKAKVRDAIESTKGLIGLNGTFTMSATDHNGLGMDALRMVEVKDGRYILAK